jgi:hypothetical protein
MYLKLGSGRIIEDATEEDVRTYLQGEDFAILEIDAGTYMQCMKRPRLGGQYALEYQDGSVDEHFRAVDKPITFERVFAAFRKYLAGDASWRDDSRWERMTLPGT